MLALIVSACLANDPVSCSEYKIPLSPNIDRSSCMLNAPPHLAQWANEHPELVIARFSCQGVQEN